MIPSRESIVLTLLRVPRLSLALCLLALPLVAVGQSFQLGEQLNYTISYRGILSSWQPLAIAKGVLETEPHPEQIDNTTVLSARLIVTTKPYDRAESFYPIRYNFQSWFEPTSYGTLLVDEARHEKGFKQSLLWFDRSKNWVHRFKRSDDRLSKTEVLPLFLRQRYEMALGVSGFRKKRGSELKPGMLDHLSLLYRMRLAPLKVGDVANFPVSDGKELASYRVEVMGEERLLQGSESQVAIKVKFEPQYLDEGSLGAIYVWYALDEGRTPIRFYSSRFFGDIEISLDGKTAGEHWREEEASEPPKHPSILDLE